MQPLDGQHLVMTWEAGRGQHPAERALTLLAAGVPDAELADLAHWPLGRRDAALLALRGATLGPEMEVHTHCPACAEEIEFSLDTRGIMNIHDPASDVPMLDMEDSGGGRWRFRTPTSGDLLAAARAGTVEDARGILIRRCLVNAPTTGAEPPEDVVAALPERMVDADPSADILFDLHCPACAHGWQADLDVAAFLWTEVDSEARRLLRDVHVLARAYGWREADILAMSSSRRRIYLDMVLG